MNKLRRRERKGNDLLKIKNDYYPSFIVHWINMTIPVLVIVLGIQNHRVTYLDESEWLKHYECGKKDKGLWQRKK